MKLSAVQPYFEAQINASAALAAFGDPLLASPENEEAVVKDLIDTRLRDPGVCIEIDQPSGSTISALHPGGYSKLSASIDVFVADKIAAPTHSPRGLALIELVVGAITVGRYPVEWAGHESLVSEHGYSLHILSFTVPVTVTK